jgi:hypothetical protein
MVEKALRIRCTLLHGSAASEVSPPHRHLFEANVFRPPKLEHTVERRDSETADFLGFANRGRYGIPKNDGRIETVLDG